MLTVSDFGAVKPDKTAMLDQREPGTCNVYKDFRFSRAMLLMLAVLHGDSSLTYQKLKGSKKTLLVPQSLSACCWRPSVPL